MHCDNHKTEVEKIGEKSEEKTSEDLPEFSFKKLSELGIFNEILFIYFFFLDFQFMHCGRRDKKNLERGIFEY